MWNTRFSNKNAGTTVKAEYLLIRINYIGYLAHRLAWVYMTGEWPTTQIDHINHSGSDNRWINLRDVSSSENSRNSSKYKRNKSGFNGVHFYKARRKWIAYIKHNSKLIYLGVFEDKEDAIDARKAANIKYGFHENHGVAA